MPNVTFAPGRDNFYRDNQIALIFNKIRFNRRLPTVVTDEQLEKLRSDVEFSRLEQTGGMIVSGSPLPPSSPPLPPAGGHVPDPVPPVTDLDKLAPPTGEPSEGRTVEEVLALTVKQIEDAVKETEDVAFLEALRDKESEDSPRTGALKAINERLQELQ